MTGLRQQNPSAAKTGTQPETLCPGIVLLVALDIFYFTFILNHWNDELYKCHVLWSTIYCIYRKHIIYSLRLVEIIESDKLIRKKSGWVWWRNLCSILQCHLNFWLWYDRLCGLGDPVPSFSLFLGFGRSNFHADMWLEYERYSKVSGFLFSLGFIQCIKSMQSLLLIPA